MSVQIDLRQMILAIASAVDLVGVDDVLHGRRVAILAVQCARELGLDQDVRNLLFNAGLLHDIGVSSTRVHRSIIDEADWEDSKIHSEQGSRLLAASPQLAVLAPIVLAHHTHWDELQKRKIDPRLALYANLVFLADRVDAEAAPHYADNSLLLHVEAICSRINRNRGGLFAPEVVDAFLRAARAEAFWLILDPMFVPQFVREMESYSDKQEMELDDLKKFASIIAEVVDAKSHFTYEHSTGVARLARFIAEHFGVAGERLDLVEVAALMHDIGKLQIPDEVLESPHRLVRWEKAIMKRHSFATYQILNKVRGMEELARWASQHHESLDGSGYPFRTIGADLCLEARIIKVADVYQALAQDRPYRKPLAPAGILSILRQMQARHKVDSLLVDFVAEHQDGCHRAALSLPADEVLASSVYESVLQ